MILIAGLGNPGKKYARNRHNAGFMFVDYIATLLHGSIDNNRTMEQSVNQFRYDKFTNAEITNSQLTTHNLQPTPILLGKPQTFMNRSGESIRKIITNYELRIDNVFIAHDDLDIELGKFKIQLGVGPKKHNGIASIEQHLHTPDFWRIRIGVDNRGGDRALTGEEYVLQDFLPDETTTLQNSFPTIMNNISLILRA